MDPSLLVSTEKKADKFYIFWKVQLERKGYPKKYILLDNVFS